MEESVDAEETTSLTRPTVVQFWLLLIGLILVCLMAYVGTYRLPHGDLLTVMHVINNLSSPELFAGADYTQLLTTFHTTTAPIYYYGLAYPLDVVLPIRWVLLVIGTLTMLASAYSAGIPWTKYKHALVATTVVFALLTVNVSPLEGNKRSFTAFFLLAALCLGRRPTYRVMLMLTALAGGIYPPVGLILMVYFVAVSLERLRRGPMTVRRFLLESSGLGVTYLAVLSPYWSSLLRGSGRGMLSRHVASLNYSLRSVDGIMETFVLGLRGTHRGALFLTREHLDLFFIMLVLCGVQYLVLKDRFRLKRRYLFMFVSGLLLWGTAHLLFPLIYFPFKYTRLTLPLVLVFPAVENLPASVKHFHDFFRKRPVLRILMYCLALAGFIAWAMDPVPGGMVENGLIGSNGLEFLFLGPLLVSLSVIRPGSSDRGTLRSLAVVLVLGGCVFLPPDVPDFSFRGRPLDAFDGLFRTLRTTSPGSVVAGPPDVMQAIPAYGSRPIFNAPDWRSNDFLCRRNEAFWKAYFATDPAEVRSFMETNDVRYLFVDRRLLRRRIIFGTRGCVQGFSASVDRRDPYLDRPFEEVRWESGDRFYLLSVESIR